MVVVVVVSPSRLLIARITPVMSVFHKGVTYIATGGRAKNDRLINDRVESCAVFLYDGHIQAISTVRSMHTDSYVYKAPLERDWCISVGTVYVYIQWNPIRLMRVLFFRLVQFVFTPAGFQCDRRKSDISRFDDSYGVLQGVCFIRLHCSPVQRRDPSVSIYHLTFFLLKPPTAVLTGPRVPCSQIIRKPGDLHLLETRNFHGYTILCLQRWNQNFVGRLLEILFTVYTLLFFLFYFILSVI